MDIGTDDKKLLAFVDEELVDALGITPENLRYYSSQSMLHFQMIKTMRDLMVILREKFE